MEKYKINLERLGLKIFAIRKENDLSMEAMAKKVGVSNGAINRYEKGRMLPKTATLKKIIKLGHDKKMTPDEFIYGSLDDYLTEIFDGVRETLANESKSEYDLLIEKLKESIQENQLPWSSQFMIVGQLYDVAKTNSKTKELLETCNGYIELRKLYKLTPIGFDIEKDSQYRSTILPLLDAMNTSGQLDYDELCRILNYKKS